MPKKHRLSRADFMSLAGARSRRVHGIYFSLVIVSAEGGSAFGGKAACVVSKKVAARAVDRNRIDRRCREALRPLLAGIKTPSAIVFYAKRDAVGASYADIEKDVRALLARTTTP